MSKGLTLLSFQMMYFDEAGDAVFRKGETMNTYEEISQLHESCMADLNRMGWTAQDLAVALELQRDMLQQLGGNCTLAKTLVEGAATPASEVVTDQVVTHWL